MPEFTPIINLSSLDGTTGFELDGQAFYDASGASVSSAGDINGDGFDDVIVGAPGVDATGSGAGASYVVFGQADGIAASLDLSALDGSNGFEIRGETDGDFSGAKVSGAGDVNGDGIDDLIIGAPGTEGNAFYGLSYVVFGRASGFGATLDLASLDGTNGFEIRGREDFQYNTASVSVSDAGDVNGDGFDDVIVGASYVDAHGIINSGASYVVFGQAEGFAPTLNPSQLDGSDGFEIRGEAIHDRSGISVSGAGDVNGDGFDDVIVGAFQANATGNNSGASYVVFGKAENFAPDLDLTSLDGSNGFQIKGEAKSDASGISVSDAGDVNGDGFADLIIGAHRADPNGSSSGASYVVFGTDTGFAATLDLSGLDGSNGFEINGAAASDYSGRSVSSAGDVNGDGYDDLIIGARDADPNGSGSGASYVVFGRASGFDANFELSSLDGDTGFRIDGEAAGDLSGASVSGAGDLNNDGFDDLIVGAPGADPHTEHSGASYVIFGHRAFDAVTRIGTDLGQTINGGFGADTISGLGGNDTLFGWQGRDEMFGGSGRDTLVGGADKDILTGGQGPDTFDYNALKASGLTNNMRDIITDFHPGADVIDLSAIDALPGGADDAFEFIGTAAFTAEGQVRVVQAGLRTRLEVNTAGPDGAEMTVALLNVTASALTEADFVL